GYLDLVHLRDGVADGRFNLGSEFAVLVQRVRNLLRADADLDHALVAVEVPRRAALDARTILPREHAEFLPDRRHLFKVVRHTCVQLDLGLGIAVHLGNFVLLGREPARAGNNLTVIICVRLALAPHVRADAAVVPLRLATGLTAGRSIRAPVDVVPSL